MFKKITIALGLLFTVNHAGAQTHKHIKGTPANISHSVSINGLVSKPATFTLADLKKMPSVVKTNVKIIGKGGVVKHTFKAVKGVLLKDLLLRAAIDNSNMKESAKWIITATATDNYQAIFSWNEVFNSPASSNILVVYEQDGKPITTDGEFVLLSLNDSITGLRHVKWLKDIKVKKTGLHA